MTSLPTRELRLQAAVVRDDHLLLLEMHIDDGRRFWLLPGGGREPGDVDDAAAIARELDEEVGLSVTVERHLFDTAAHPDDYTYRRYRTFVCRAPVDAEPTVGRRDGIAQITRVRWLSLRDPAAWGDDICGDRFLYPQLVAIRHALATALPSA